MESALDYFLSNYFHQDFNEDFGDQWGALDSFLEHEQEQAVAVPSEVKQLLATHPTEDELDVYLTDLGCEYRASAEDGGYRGWLTEIARRVEAATTS